MSIKFSISVFPSIDPAFVRRIVPEFQQTGHILRRDITFLRAHLGDGVQVAEAHILHTGGGHPLDTLLHAVGEDAHHAQHLSARFPQGLHGLQHAAIAAHLLGLPMGYVRSGNKDHGRQNRIEGRLDKGEKVVVVEDLISTGGSVLDAVDALREAGAEVLGVVSIFTYGMKKGVERLAAAQVRNVSLTDLDTVASTGAQEGYITEADVARLLAFRENPSDESWIQAESQA